MTSLWIQDCAGNKLDPHFAAHELPISQYAKACYEGWIPKDSLELAFDQAVETLEQAKNKWGKAKGPIAASILTARRLGWEWHSATELTTDTKMKLNLLEDSPAFVQQQVTEAVRRLICRQFDLAQPMLNSGGRGPVTSGLRKVLRRPRDLSSMHRLWNKKCKASLHSAVVNGQWTQSRLHRAKLVESDLCKLCGEAKGTPIHRHQCQATAAHREECTNDK